MLDIALIQNNQKSIEDFISSLENIKNTFRLIVICGNDSIIKHDYFLNLTADDIDIDYCEGIVPIFVKNKVNYQEGKKLAIKEFFKSSNRFLIISNGNEIISSPSLIRESMEEFQRDEHKLEMKLNNLEIFDRKKFK